MSFQTIHRSLSFDTIIIPHPTRAAAEAHMVQMLTTHGWPLGEAREKAKTARETMVTDNGDDETIQIRKVR